MNYSDEIDIILSKIDKNIINFDYEKKCGRIPTTASSEFLTNKAQGDWAEEVIFNSGNNQIEDLVFVRYGANNNILVGDEGFKDYYHTYQEELETIGKRPDILVFKKDVYKEEWGIDIASEKKEDVEHIVSKAIAGLEVRSSSFRKKVYDKHKREIFENSQMKIITYIEEILKENKNSIAPSLAKEFEEILKVSKEKQKKELKNLCFRIKVNKDVEECEIVKKKLKEIKEELKVIKRRDYLSFTPKMEDVRLVKKWINTYDVPHFYIQVFQDQVFGISFKEILEKMTVEKKEEQEFILEKDIKNQMKTTIKIDVRKGCYLGELKKEPQSKSLKKMLNNGKVINYTAFEYEEMILDVENFNILLSN